MDTCSPPHLCPFPSCHFLHEESLRLCGSMAADSLGALCPMLHPAPRLLVKLSIQRSSSERRMRIKRLLKRPHSKLGYRSPVHYAAQLSRSPTSGWPPATLRRGSTNQNQYHNLNPSLRLTLRVARKNVSRQASLPRVWVTLWPTLSRPACDRLRFSGFASVVLPKAVRSNGPTTAPRPQHEHSLRRIRPRAAVG